MVNHQRPTNQQPFWVDEQITPTFTPRSTSVFSRVIIIYLNVILWLVLVSIVLIIWFSISQLLALAIIILLLASIIFGYARARRSKSLTEQIIFIQKQARELTGAELIGSAVHVAGHPNLEPKQPVVLVLRENTLVIYPFDKPIVSDEINVRDIETIQTVVYDEDRIPHVDVIDPTAQALQLRIVRHDKNWQCLLNQMRSIRPIDWYHAIQKAKVDPDL